MKKTVVFISLFFGGVCIAVIAISPNVISAAFSLVMSAAVAFGVAFGMIPNLLYAKAFKKGIENVNSAKKLSANNVFAAVSSINPFFGNKALDDLFESYKENVALQKENGAIFSDIEDVFNEDALSVRSWRGVVAQIAGTLTSLGLLGTFLGLITGVSGVTFSSVEATMTSIETLLKGIATAFYTSICGVVLSIIFYVAYRIVWSVMQRQM